MTQQRPAFVIVCDHNEPSGQCDVIARFTWAPHRAGIGGAAFDGSWHLPLQFTTARITLLTGDDHSHPHLGDVPTRTHYEIPCDATGCSRRAYRSDEARLQRLLSLIVDKPEFRAVIAKEFPGVSDSDEQITVTLDALHWARDTAKSYGLHV